VCRGTVYTLPVRTSVREENISWWEKGLLTFLNMDDCGQCVTGVRSRSGFYSVSYLYGILYMAHITHTTHCTRLRDDTDGVISTNHGV
jgi:hypothetical protein